MPSSHITLSKSWVNISPSNRRYMILCFILFIWMLRGIFPLTCYESDSLRMISGGSVLFNQGFSLPPVLAYQYNMQPLIVYTIGVLKYVLPFLSCEAIYSALTALFSFAFIPISVEFVHKLTSISRDIILISVILFPESYAIAMYPNSAIIPEVISLIAFLLILYEKKTWVSIMLLCIAPVFRIDIIIVYPAIFFLYIFKKDSFKSSFLKSLTTGATVVLFLIAAYYLFQADPFYIMGKSDEVNADANLLVPIIAIFSFYTPVNFLLIPIGIYFLLKDRKVLLLSLSVLPILLVHYIFRYNGGATKHYLYILPFAVVLTSHAIQAFAHQFSKRKVFSYSLLALFLLYSIISIRIDFPHRPWRNMPQSFTQLAVHIPMFEFDSVSLTKVGIGGGLGFTTADEIMLTTGWLFYSDYIHRIKVNKRNDMLRVKEKLDTIKNYKLIAMEWGDTMLMPLLLLEEGYEYKAITKKLFELRNGGSFISSYCKNAFYSSDSITKALENCKENLPNDDRPVYIISLSDSYMYALDEYCTEGKATKIMHGLYQVTL